jgi:hypothetical protein
MKTNYGNPESINKICEWTGKSFTVDWKHRNKRFIDKEAMYSWRKSQNREMVSCLNCNKLFERYKKILHPRSGKLQQYCSNECNRSSKEKKEKLKIWITDNNPMKDPISVEKISKTKLEKYGNYKYNNPEKAANTCMRKYGTACYFDSPSAILSNGKRISKFQKQTYDLVLLEYPDARLEEYLKDARCSVDIYIPSLKKAIECYGDYWHCNPSKCQPDYYNKSLRMTAKEKWNKDAIRTDKLVLAGYGVEIVWENSKKKLAHSTKS